MKLYHRTDHAEEILTSGFTDRGDFLTTSLRAEGGVWLSDKPLPDAYGGNMFSIEIPARVVADLERPMKRRGVREFLVPAAVVNRYGPPMLVEEES